MHNRNREDQTNMASLIARSPEGQGIPTCASEGRGGCACGCNPSQEEGQTRGQEARNSWDYSPYVGWGIDEMDRFDFWLTFYKIKKRLGL